MADLGEQRRESGTPSRFTRIADKLARVGWRALIAVVVLALLGGLIAAILDPGPAASPPVAGDHCPTPPCFSIGTPRASDLLVIIPALGYAIVILLGVPDALVGLRDLFGGGRRIALARLLVLAGPVVVFVGMELVPHLVNPRLVAGDRLAGFCERTAHDPSSVDVTGRWHALHHAVIGAVPMTALYGWALRRWRGDI